MNMDFIDSSQKRNEFLKDFFTIRQFTSDNIDLVKKHGLFKDISKNDCDKIIEEINEEFSKYFEGITDFKEYFYSNAITYCIEKFVDSEMDYTTPGIRGLGRISTAFPRFGGFYSEFLKKLPNDDLKKINKTILEIIKYGYMTFMFMDVESEQELKKLKSINNESFFQKWIPKIYSSNFSDNHTVTEYLTQSEWDSLIYFCLKIEKETNFPKNILDLSNIKESKLALIIVYYVRAGFILRYFEKTF